MRRTVPCRSRAVEIDRAPFSDPLTGPREVPRGPLHSSRIRRAAPRSARVRSFFSGLNFFLSFLYIEKEGRAPLDLSSSQWLESTYLACPPKRRDAHPSCQFRGAGVKMQQPDPQVTELTRLMRRAYVERKALREKYPFKLPDVSRKDVIKAL